MTENEKHDFYNALDKNSVTVKTEKQDMKPSGFCIQTKYFFDNYEIDYSVYSDFPNNFLVYIIKRTPEKSHRFKCFGRYADSDSEHVKKEFRHIYDMYIATKNKHEGKPYFNPYKDDKMTVFSMILNENSGNLFPINMPSDRRLEAMNELKQVFHKHILRYKENSK